MEPQSPNENPTLECSGISQLPNELLSEILEPFFCVPDDKFSSTEPVSPFSNYGLPSLPPLMVCKLWYQIGIPLLYETVVIRSPGQAYALSQTLEGKRGIWKNRRGRRAARHGGNSNKRELGHAKYIKKLRLEGWYGSYSASILELCGTGLEVLWMTTSLGSREAPTNYDRGLKAVDPVRAILYNSQLKTGTSKLQKDATSFLKDALESWSRMDSLVVVSHENFENLSELISAIPDTSRLRHLTLGDRYSCQTYGSLWTLLHYYDISKQLKRLTTLRVVDNQRTAIPDDWASHKEARYVELARDTAFVKKIEWVKPPSKDPWDCTLPLPKTWINTMLAEPEVKERGGFLQRVPRSDCEDDPDSELLVCHISKPKAFRRFFSAGRLHYMSRLCLDFSSLPLVSDQKLAETLELSFRRCVNLEEFIALEYWELNNRYSPRYYPARETEHHPVPRPGIRWYTFRTLAEGVGRRLTRLQVPVVVNDADELLQAEGNFFYLLRQLGELKILVVDVQLPRMSGVERVPLRTGPVIVWPDALPNLEHLTFVSWPRAYTTRFLETFSYMSLPSLRRLEFPICGRESFARTDIQCFLAVHGHKIVMLEIDPIIPGLIPDYCPNVVTWRIPTGVLGTVAGFDPRCLESSSEGFVDMKLEIIRLGTIDISQEALDALMGHDFSMMFRLLEIRVEDPAFSWPRNQRDIDKSKWVPLAERLFDIGIRLTDVHGTGWRPRLKNPTATKRSKKKKAITTIASQ
ncbi:hypothetical protein CC1G_10190 [Coprinopsis cinerea okayama7|uniref:Uncharacterized protein n=1 Tax=Coprinopsis cinerea (strain Okayama-7 / 130 / ATCC MYA-4618 / FGSC 9003) TaxID=240176 RepID=A8PGD9_COPC7|nr:hypothetical protein CC1G_10190 [Coprinopsis cinerea okayama7\|eukprot:XP_001841193.2 hypothetical protein CC1G_10190 [Coprinopsis cinerea okayama7\